MFFGTYLHSLDEKGRLVIPSKLRSELGFKAYIMKGYDGALSIFKESAFEKLVNEINSLPFNKKATRDFLRIQLGSVCELEIDKTGRVQIPTMLLSKYSIGKDVVVLGAADHIEVWDKTIYEEYERKANSSFEEIAENLGGDN